jgi:hypothetical protein
MLRENCISPDSAQRAREIKGGKTLEIREFMLQSFTYVS